MINRTFLLLSTLVLIPSTAVQADPPRKISDIISPAELEAEIAAKLAELEPWIGSEDAFVENRKKIGQSASMLIVAAQALAEHDAPSDLKPYAADLRDAGLQIARAEKQSDAAAGFSAAQTAASRQSPKSTTLAYDWGKLVKQRPIMEDMETQLQRLQRAMRRPKDSAAEARIAAVVAVANLTTVADTHEVKDAAKLPEWDRLSQLMIDQLVETAAAIRRKDTMAAQASFKAARATCVDCHRQFKKEN